MEGAFTHVGNHLISDSAAAIKAGADDLSALDPDETLLYGKYPSGTGRRRTDDDDNQTDAHDEDDADSVDNAFQVNFLQCPPDASAEDNFIQDLPADQKELPPHACT